MKHNAKQRKLCISFSMRHGFATVMLIYIILISFFVHFYIVYRKIMKIMSQIIVMVLKIWLFSFFHLFCKIFVIFFQLTVVTIPVSFPVLCLRTLILKCVFFLLFLLLDFLSLVPVFFGCVRNSP